jgi:hypothetical protein
MPRPKLPDPTELIAQRQASTPASPPVLPSQWRASVLLTPFGDASPLMKNYSQLVVADVYYDYTVPGMLVNLYLTEDLTFFSFLFTDGTWTWVDSTPNGPITNFYGPFPTSLTVPPPDFLGQSGSQFGNNYGLMGKSCDHWVLPTDSTHGSWYSFRQDTGNLYRIFTFDADNPVRIPILGSFYLANIPTLVPQSGSTVVADAVHMATSGRTTAVPGMSNPLVTQEDIQGALANPLASAPCTLAQIQAVIPGISIPSPTSVPVPTWTDQTFIWAMTIGTDFIPYITLVFYSWTLLQQQSIFIGLGLIAGEGSYTDRQDCCLFSDHTDVPQYYFQNGQYVASCCDGTIPGVGLPRPTWLQDDGGVVVAQIAGNADFGLAPGEVLNMFNAPLARGPGDLALVWVWFKGDGTGVLFTEANYDKPMDHNLQLIDYTIFEQNASWMTASVFSDPCPQLQACSTQPGALARANDERRLIGPRTVTRGPAVPASLPDIGAPTKAQ